MAKDLETKGALTLNEACNYLGGISRPTIYKLLGEGKLPSFMIGTRRYFRRDSLDSYMQEQEGTWEYEDEDAGEGNSIVIRGERINPEDYRDNR